MVLEHIHDCDRVTDALNSILLEEQVEAIDRHRIDYADMIWLPVHWELWSKKWFKTYDWVLIDEAQDLNAAQLELSLSLVSDRGRILAVGDPKQSVFGFTGAGVNSYQQIIDRTQATELPLSLCYRCPKTHIDLVNKIYPHIPIKALPNAPQGSLQTITEKDLWNPSHPGALVVGDMVLCRKTAPLVSLCIRLISHGIAATVKGKDIGKQIKAELEKISEINGFVYSKFNFYLEQYKIFKFNVFSGRDNEEQLKENLADKLDALITIYSSQPNAKNIVHLSNYIDDLFSDEESPITLSTVHRAKGLESDRLFILKPQDMPMAWESQKKWQQDQEDNLLYVALTRSKSKLFIVGKPDWLTEVSHLPEKKSRCSKDKNEDAVSSLQSTSQADAQQIKSLIAQLGFVERCQLFDDFKSSINQEKRIMVAEALQVNVHRSDRAIASVCNVSAPFVAKIRKQLIQEDRIAAEDTRVDRRGFIRKSPIMND